MSKVRVTLPGGEIPVNGKQVSFIAPCTCAGTRCLHIDGIDYSIVDAIGNPPNHAWVEGAIVTVVLDVDNAKAYLQNGAIAAANPMNIDFVDRTTTYNEDGSVTEVSPTHGTKTTVFNEDGSITETFTFTGVTTTKITTFNSDGSITEVVL